MPAGCGAGRQRVRILVVSQFYKPEPVPKAHELSTSLVERGHTVTVVTGFPCYPGGRLYPGYRLLLARREVIDGVRVLRVPLFPSHGASTVGRVLNFVTFALASATVGLALSGPADLVYVWG